MHETGPLFLVDTRVRSGESDVTRLLFGCDDAEHFVRVLRDGIATGRIFVATESALDAGAETAVVLTFPGLLRPVYLDGVVASSPAPDAPDRDEGGSSDSRRGLDVTLVDLDSQAEKRLSDFIEKIETRDPEYVARAIRVLVVEDNPHCAKLIQEGLHLASKRAFGNRVVFDVPMASNAADAFTFLHSRPIDVLITDIYLGGVSGTTVIEHVRRDSGLRSIPVIAISAGDEATKQVAMEAGADVFLAKPVRLRQIVGTVGRVLNLEQLAWR